MEQGDIIEVHWWDIMEDPTGNPNKPAMVERATIARFWNWTSQSGTDWLVTTTTLDPDGPEQQGYCVYPKGCIKSIEVPRKKRGRRKHGTQVAVVVAAGTGEVHLAGGEEEGRPEGGQAGGGGRS